MAKSKEHYVNNKDFLHAIIQYKNKVEKARSRRQKTTIKVSTWGCFLKIAQHLSYKANFVNYMFKDDMIGDGIENCITYIDNFDPAESSNPFAYFTQIIYYAFLRRIQKKKQVDIKNKMIEKSGYSEVFTGDEYGCDSSYEQIKNSQAEMRRWWKSYYYGPALWMRKVVKFFTTTWINFWRGVSFWKNKITTVLDLGDTFDNRKSIDFWSLDWAKKTIMIFYKPRHRVYPVVGNHTAYFKKHSWYQCCQLATSGIW